MSLLNKDEISEDEYKFIQYIKKAFKENEEEAQATINRRLESFCQMGSFDMVLFKWAGEEKKPKVGSTGANGTKLLTDEEVLTVVMGSFNLFASFIEGAGFKVSQMKNFFVMVLYEVIYNALKEEGDFIFNYTLDEPVFLKTENGKGKEFNFAKYITIELDKIVIS